MDTIPPPTISPSSSEASVAASTSIALSNGLLRREFITTPAFGTTDVFNMATNESQGVDTWNLMPWTPGRRASPKSAEWPPHGRRLAVRFKAPKTAPAHYAALNLTMVYELHDGAPLMSKWIEISVLPDKSLPSAVVIEQLATELLALNCDFSPQARTRPGTGYISGLLHGSENTFTKSVNASNDPGVCEPVLTAQYYAHDRPSLGARVSSELPSNRTAPFGGSFASFRTMIIVHDSFDPTR
jgi:hypothetical protein